MPYTHKVCSACEHDAGDRYHNVRKCPACGQLTLVAVNPYEHQSPCVCREENLSLRREVNALRNKLGWGIKYREWITFPTNKAGIEVKELLNVPSQ